MRKSPVIYLDHILDSVMRLENYLIGVSHKEFLENYEKQDSVVRRLEIMGEAIRNLPDEFLDKYPEIPWQDIVDFRNVLIHEYFDINLDRVWKTIKRDIPELKLKLENILGKLK